jgi:hypothetical protein
MLHNILGFVGFTIAIASVVATTYVQAHSSKS